MNDNQILREKLKSVRNDLNNLLEYYEELKKIIEDNLVVDGQMYNKEEYNKLCNDVHNIKKELDELINSLN